MTDALPVPSSSRPAFNRFLLVALAIIIAGSSLRLGTAPYKRGGYDEVLYAGYVETLNTHGMSSYPKLVRLYIKQQISSGVTRLPPTRFLYILMACSWSNTFGASPLESLLAISRLFSILMLPLAAIFAYRLGGERISLGVLTLMSVSPMQIYVSRHALIDGFFAFWALLSLWLLWENLRKPRYGLGLVLYSLALAMMVMTKENAFFVFFAITGIIAINPWAKFGTVSLPLVLCTLAGGTLGTAVLAFLSGGLETCMEIYLVLMNSASRFPYSIATGDGPWYRYIYDYMLVSPIVLLLAIGAIFHMRRDKTAQLYLLAFVGFSYLVMCNVKYGMNLRYANMWDLPLRYLAFSRLDDFCGIFKKRKTLALVLCMAALSAYELRQYYILFVQYNLYELITAALTYALRIVKPGL